jgi:hypothetical protein
LTEVQRGTLSGDQIGDLTEVLKGHLTVVLIEVLSEVLKEVLIWIETEKEKLGTATVIVITLFLPETERRMFDDHCLMRKDMTVHLMVGEHEMKEVDILTKWIEIATMILHLHVKILAVWSTDVLVLIPGTFQKIGEDVGRDTTTSNHCAVVTHGKVESVIQGIGRESKEIERGSCMNVSGNCVNENKNDAGDMNVKSPGLPDLL